MLFKMFRRMGGKLRKRRRVDDNGYYDYDEFVLHSRLLKQNFFKNSFFQGQREV